MSDRDRIIALERTLRELMTNQLAHLPARWGEDSGSGDEDEIRYVAIITANSVPAGTTSEPGSSAHPVTPPTFTIKQISGELGTGGGGLPVAQGSYIEPSPAFPEDTAHVLLNPFPYAAHPGIYAVDLVEDVALLSGSIGQLFWRITGFDLTGLESWVIGDFQVLIHETGEPPSWGDASAFEGPMGPQGPQGIPGTPGPTYTGGCGIDVAGTVISINRANLLGTGLAADTGTCNIRVKVFTANITTAINAGSASSLTSGGGTVYEVNADGSTTSLGAKTIFNYCNHKVKGAVRVSQLSSDNFIVGGFDILEAEFLRPGAAEKKSYALPEGATVPTDIQWLGEEC